MHSFNLSFPQAPVYGMNRLPQPHMYAYQQPTHTPPLQTAACMYPQDQVFGTPIRFESPATSLLSPYNEEYCSHNVSQPSTNPALPEPGYFTKPPVIPAQSCKTSEGKSMDLKMSFGQQIQVESSKVVAGNASQTTPTAAAFKFNSNFKSNDGDFTFSSAEGKDNSESLLGLLTSDIPFRTESPSGLKSQSQDPAPSRSGVFTFGSKNALGFSLVDGAQGKTTLFGNSDQAFSFGNLTKPVTGEESDEKCAESDDSTHVEEDEDGPHFEPIVPLPNKIDVKTGEEEEEELFCNRAKLFRFEAETKEWKERGIGSIKILKHKISGKYRLLMRREQVLKICANHYITADMVLKPNAGSDKSWVWHAMDYADEMPKTEQLAIRFKTSDEAALFKQKFEEAQRAVVEHPKMQGQLKKNDSKTSTLEEASKNIDLKTLFAKKEGEWDCNVCSVRNNCSSKECVACSSPNPYGDSKPETKSAEGFKSAPAASSSMGTFTFGIISSEDASGDVSTKAFGSQIPFSFKFGTPQFSLGESKSNSFSFGSGFGTPFGKKPGQWDCSTCGVRNEVSASTCVACQTKTTAAEESTKQSANSVCSASSGLEKFVKKAGQWDCDTCLVRNEAAATNCVSCSAPCSSRKNEAQWDCDACLVRNEGICSHCVSCKKPNPNADSTKDAAVPSFSFSTDSQTKHPASTGIVASFETETSGSSKLSFSVPGLTSGFKFGLKGSDSKPSNSGSASMFLKNIAERHTEKETSLFLQSESKPSSDDCPLITGKQNAFSFADLAKSSQGNFQFGQKDPSFKGFARAGEQLFTSFLQSQKADTSIDQEEEDMYKTEENDDIQFEPVVKMPEKVDLVTGEEEEECLYTIRVKLFRFDNETHQWKERGVGNLKLLKNNQNGRLRVLMRREQVLKVCANHWITTSMNLKPLSGSDRAWVWLANDFSDGDPKLEQLAAKFKNPELAEEFKQKFEECQRLLLDIPLQTPHKLANSDRTANLIQKAEEMKSGLKDLKSFLTYDGKKDEQKENGVSTADSLSALIIKPHSESIGPTLEWDDVNDESADTSAYASPLASSPLQKNLFRFGESSSGFSFSFQPILSPSKSPSMLNQSGTYVGTDEQEINQEEERDGQFFEPVVPMPDVVELLNGEENEQVVFSHRAKLYRYDKDLSQWKERGIGDIKILQNYDTKRTRLVMRRDQVLKLCANHWITLDMKLEPMKGAEKAWIWSAYDYAEGEGKVEQLAVRFKLLETANSFKEFFEKAMDAQEKETLLVSALPREVLTSPKSLCGEAAIEVLEETTKEKTEQLSVSSQVPAMTLSPKNASKTVVSPPKFVFGTDSVQKIFASPVSSKQMVPSPATSSEVQKSDSPSSSRTAVSKTITPFKVPERGEISTKPYN